LTGGCCAAVGALGVRAVVEAGGAGAGTTGAGAGFGAGGAAAVLVAPPTVTIELIFSIVFFGTPAFARSATDVYGRPAMIFFAVAGPTPGRATRSDSEAVLRLTTAAGAF